LDQHDLRATTGDADMKLGRCVVGTNMQLEFEVGCRTVRVLRDQSHI